VATGTGQRCVEFGHESDSQAQLIGQFLEDLFVEQVAVGHIQHFGVTDVGFVLSWPPLPLAGLNRDAAPGQMAARRRVQHLFSRALQDVIILDVRAEGLQILVMLAAGLAVRLVEDVVFQLCAGLDGIAHLCGRGDLAFEKVARGNGDRGVRTFVVYIAKHERGSVEPGGGAQRAHIGDAVEIAVTHFPVGVGVARHRLHLHVRREQVVAGVHAAPGHAI